MLNKVYLVCVARYFWWCCTIQCETDAGRNELTRVAVVNEQRECVYETLVKPRRQITNYFTKYVTFCWSVSINSALLAECAGK